MLQNNEYDRKEDIEHIKGQYALADTNSPGDSLDPLALESQMQEREKMAEDSRLKEKELDLKDKISQRQEDTKKYVADKSLQVAKENKTQAELKAKKSNAKKSS